MTRDDGTKTVLVGVTGGVAVYKACEIVRGLQKAGYRVKVMMSEHATRFVDPVTFRALTHEPVVVGLFDDPSDPIHHISLAQEADLVLVAPATANIIAKMAHGVADDLISTTLLATPAPILVAPAMNSGMWRAAATQENIATLRRRGVAMVGPGSGYLACGDVDTGRLEDPSTIVDAACAILEGTDELAGERIVITAGPTHEPIDPVRFIGNRSSGKMGVALARQALRLGAQVTLILGPGTVEPPSGAQVVRVETALEMLDAAVAAFTDATAAICTAAVCDWRVAEAAPAKLKKSSASAPPKLALVENPDILATLAAAKGERTVVGFAAETNDVVAYAARKLQTKGCDAIIANDVSRADSTFGSDTDKAWIVTASGVDELPVLSKDELAHTILLRLRDF